MVIAGCAVASTVLNYLTLGERLEVAPQRGLKRSMGVWSTGLYAGDFALDLRSTIQGSRPLAVRRGQTRRTSWVRRNQRAAGNPEDEDHTTFWLVVADQFAKRGIVSDRARETALTDYRRAAADMAMLEKLGMDPASPEKTSRRSLKSCARGSPRRPAAKTTSRSQETAGVCDGCGRCFASDPTCEGNAVSIRISPRRSETSAWKGQDGWSAAVIVDRGRAFEFLTWYRPVTLVIALRNTAHARHAAWRRPMAARAYRHMLGESF